MRHNSNNNNMETFYEENAQQFCPTTQASIGGNLNNNNSNCMKRPLTLDLNTKLPKRQRFNQSLSSAPVLESPDLNKLKMESPDMERFLINNSSLQTPTPNLVFPTKVTSEQEGFAKGFEEALSSLHSNHSNNSENTTTTMYSSSPIITNNMCGGGIVYTNLDETFPVIKDEPQTVPNSPPLSPIDLESQEQMKLERKRQRNRVAASKCRKRKLERISKLEDKVKILKSENTELSSIVISLKELVSKLKQQVMEHAGSGCTIQFNRL
jgi:transcription factor AP-1